MKLSRFSFRAGPRPGAAGVTVRDPEVVLLVGPNNSGKSLSLREIENWCFGVNEQRRVLDQIEVTLPATLDSAIELFRQFETDPPPERAKEADHIWLGLPTFRSDRQFIHEQISVDVARRVFGQEDRTWLRQQLTRLYTARLDGRTRFALSDPKATGDLQSHPQNHLWALFKDDRAREKVRAFTEEAFGQHFVVDPTAMTQFRVRMSLRAPADKAEEQALDVRARAFHQAAPLISNLSDGMQAFVGLVSAVLSLPHRIILIDEPEAFLHPPLARRLGKNLSQLTRERGATLLVATHSADFVMGCVEAGVSVQILRLTYEQGQATTRSLSTTQLTNLMRDPLLRSAQALRGLFHKGVVVTEADKDRAFYEEINYRLQAARRGVGDVMFMNAQNWQTIARLVTPLRSVGIPAAAIMDLDVLAEVPGWDAIYDMLALNPPARAQLEMRKQAAGAALIAAGRQACKIQGVAAVNAGRVDVEAAIDELRQYGVFIVAQGELESWLAADGVPHDPKNDWLARAFIRLGSDPAANAYVAAGMGGVWEFVESVGRWIADPQRLGMP